MFKRVALLAVLIFAFSICIAEAVPRYRICDLGRTGSYDTYAVDINEVGQALYYTAFGLTTLWNPNGDQVDIPLPIGAQYSTAYAINDNGQIVGQAAYIGGGWGKAWIWDGDVKVIDVLPGYKYNGADDINNAGTVVGLAINWPGDWINASAFKWSPDTGLTRLAPIPGFKGSIAHSINDHDVVVGASHPGAGAYWQACLWTADGTVHRISPLGTSYSSAVGINNPGQVTLVARTPNLGDRAYLWSEQTGFRDIGDLGGGESWSLGLNSYGQVVGRSYTASRDTQAFFWSEESGMIGLPGLPTSTYSQARAINDDGSIVGISNSHINPGFHAVLWTPVFDVQVDIKPGNPNNNVNLRSNAVVPVAVMTTAEFDAGKIEPSTVLMAGAKPVRWHMEDVDQDGDSDLLMFFRARELKVSDGEPALLTGEAYGGPIIEGRDSINIVP